MRMRKKQGFRAAAPLTRYSSSTLNTLRTYDDVLLLPGHSKHPPEQTSTRSWITRNVPIIVPAISAAMKTVTDDVMAIAMAKAGACGVIHYDMAPLVQAKKVARVRFEQQCYIKSPVPVYEDTRVADHLAERQQWVQEGKKGFDKQPVLNRQDEVVGLLTGTDLQYCKDTSVAIGKIMTPIEELVTAKPGTTAERAYKTTLDHKVSALLVIPRNRKHPGMFLFKDLERKFENNNAGYNVDSGGALIVGAAMGVGGSEFERAELLVKHGASFIVMDCSHAHTDAARAQLRRIKAKLDIDVVAGNVATREGGIFLAKAGADAVKVGVGPGSICTTRDVAGVGVPQLDAVIAVADAVRRFNIPVIADGGVSKLGHFGRALAKADTVMCGNVFAGTDEAAGGIIVVDGEEYREYSGMAAQSAMAGKAAGMRYRQSKKIVPEGEDGAVPSKGPVGPIVKQIAGAIQITLGLVGARNISELHRKARFIGITESGRRESTTHDIKVVRG